ncbi:MAG: methylthioribose-1-phosphate isomerase [Pseudohongiellaceae bacterium]
MKVDGQHYQSIWYDELNQSVWCIDQTKLPHDFVIIELDSLDAACHAILSMQVRGAPLIGITAAYGLYLALKSDSTSYSNARIALLKTRPTAVNLKWALDRMDAKCMGVEGKELVQMALITARNLEAQDRQVCESIGEYGARVLKSLWESKGSAEPLNVLTHCNAGWLATVDWGTALAVVYKANELGVPLHVWVDETRPRNQGASLTCWELGKHGISHTLVVDNVGGHLMQHGKVDVCIVGSDRCTKTGDVCNKVGTYLKALAAFDNAVPFYVALPISTIDFTMTNGIAEIPIEERSASEVTHISGLANSGLVETIRLTPANVKVHNIGFDVTPARLVTGIITEKGVYGANEPELSCLDRET